MGTTADDNSFVDACTPLAAACTFLGCDDWDNCDAWDDGDFFISYLNVAHEGEGAAL